MAALALVARPVAAEDRSGWEAEGGASYITSGGDFRGWGVQARLLYGVGRYFAAGLSADLIDAGASGTDGRTQRPYRYSFLSFFGAGMVELRVPVGPVTPYVDGSFGLAHTSTVENVESQCLYGSGSVTVGVGLGAEMLIDRRFVVGVRGSARSPASGAGCTPIVGLHSFPGNNTILFGLGGTVGLVF